MHYAGGFCLKTLVGDKGFSLISETLSEVQSSSSLCSSQSRPTTLHSAWHQLDLVDNSSVACSDVCMALVTSIVSQPVMCRTQLVSA